MPDYQDSKIYKIVCDETNLTYYGSTTQPLSKRLHQHKSNSRCMTKDMTNPKIFLVETFPCNTKEELHSRERFYVEENPCCNKVVPLRTYKEWCEDNKEKLKEYSKDYREDNKEKLKEKSKEYREANKEILKEKKKEYYLDNKDKIKENVSKWVENNKEKVRDYKRKYKKNHRAELNKSRNERRAILPKVTCECGSVVSRQNISTHRKSQKHIKHIIIENQN